MHGNGKTPILVVAHGSPEKINHEDFFKLAKELRKLNENTKICFLEFGSPSLDKALAEIKKSETEVFLQPLLMFRAGHMKKDIPRAIERSETAKLVKLGKPLAEYPEIVELFAEELEKHLSSDDTLVLCVGRGTSDPEGASETYRFSRLVWEKAGKKGNLQVCFAGVTHPLVKDIISFVRPETYSKIVVLPLIFFRGFVLNRITEMLKENQNIISKKKLNIINPLGYMYPEKIAKIIFRRAKATL